jgi:hypothetical protein
MSPIGPSLQMMSQAANKQSRPQTASWVGNFDAAELEIFLLRFRKHKPSPLLKTESFKLHVTSEVYCVAIKNIDLKQT